MGKVLPLEIWRYIYSFQFGYKKDIHTPCFIGSTGNIEGAKYIIKKGYWSEEEIGQCMFSALLDKRIEFCKQLVPGKYLLDTENSEYVLRHASFKGDIETVEFLIQNGTNPNNEWATTWASQAGQWEIVHYLLENGALITRPIIYECIRSGNEKFLIYLLEHGAQLIFPQLSLMTAIQYNHARAVQIILEREGFEITPYIYNYTKELGNPEIIAILELGK